MLQFVGGWVRWKISELWQLAKLKVGLSVGTWPPQTYFDQIIPLQVFLDVLPDTSFTFLFNLFLITQHTLPIHQARRQARVRPLTTCFKALCVIWSNIALCQMSKVAPTRNTEFAIRCMAKRIWSWEVRISLLLEFSFDIWEIRDQFQYSGNQYPAPNYFSNSGHFTRTTVGELSQKHSQIWQNKEIYTLLLWNCCKR